MAESFPAIRAVRKRETYAMLLSGLGHLGSAGRRRKQKSTRARFAAARTTRVPGRNHAGKVENDTNMLSEQSPSN